MAKNTSLPIFANFCCKLEGNAPTATVGSTALFMTNSVKPTTIQNTMCMFGCVRVCIQMYVHAFSANFP